MTQTVQIDKITLTLTGKTLQAVLQGISELPWHTAHPAMTEIETQIKLHLDAKTAPQEAKNDPA